QRSIRLAALSATCQRIYFWSCGRATESSRFRCQERRQGLAQGSPRHFHGAPEVPARDRAVRLPSTTALFDLLARRQCALLEGEREALANSVIVDREHVWAAEAEDEQHLRRPPADPAHLRQPFDDRLVIHALDLGQRG